MTLAVLCYDTCEVDIIRNVRVSDKKIESYLIDKLGYDPDNISWMYCRDLKVNELTPKSFG